MQDPLLGQVLDGRYRMLERIGRGGMGVVYLAEHVLLHRKFAVKVLPFDLCDSEHGTERFLREARAAAAVGEHHVVDVTDVGVLQTGQRYIVLEYLEGMDLCEHVRQKGPLPVPLAVDLLTQLSEALTAVHAAGIVHRDLKPENLFLVQRGGRDFVKVLDFGVCKFNSTESLARLSTDTGSTLGTPNYMAPEQVHDAKHVDHRADIYALGAVGYFLLTGRAPFSGASLPALFMAICHAPIKPPHELRSDIPRPLSQLLLRALARDPAERFATCGALGEALVSVGAEHGDGSAFRERTITLGRPSAAPRATAPAEEARVATVRADEPTLASFADSPDTVLRTPTLPADATTENAGPRHRARRPSRPAARALVLAAAVGLLGLWGAAAWSEPKTSQLAITDVQAATRPSGPAVQTHGALETSVSDRLPESDRLLAVSAEPPAPTTPTARIAARASATESPVAKPPSARPTARPQKRRERPARHPAGADTTASTDAAKSVSESVGVAAAPAPSAPSAAPAVASGPSASGGDAEPVPASQRSSAGGYRLSTRGLQTVFAEGAP